MLGRELATPTTHPATIASDFIKPHGQSLGTFDTFQMRYGLQQDVLHRIFRVFAVTTHLHAEGKDSSLQKPQSFVDRGTIALSNKFNCQPDLWSHEL